jgi:hypothetical protein
METLVEVGLPIASFFIGIGVTIGVVKTQMNGMATTVKNNCEDIRRLGAQSEDIRLQAVEKMSEVSQRLMRIETKLGIDSPTSVVHK